jgi:hypothetical protein
VPLEGFERERIDLSDGLAPSGIGLDAALAEVVEEHLAQDRAGGIAGAEHENVQGHSVFLVRQGWPWQQFSVR